jgi:predicted RNase H-like HicB family nuclease
MDLQTGCWKEGPVKRQRRSAVKGNKMRIDYTVQIWREGAQYVAQAMPVDVVSAGSTPDQARAALDEAVGLFLSTAQEMGTLREVLEECAYELLEST